MTASTDPDVRADGDSAEKELTLVVHAHFYQPPREDPRTGEVPVEPGAAPWHDFNAKIAAECYHPNLAARVMDGDGRVADLVDNYAHLSFNMGPTLLQWLETHASETYARILESAYDSGNAIAQGFNHVIMPLCNDRDLRTQVRWGLADFRFRFGRPARGFWLPETAVNDRVLAVLAEEGVAFTILAPRQAEAVRALGVEEEWTGTSDGQLDTSVLYRWRHPHDPELGLAVLFYDGALSHDVAFAIGSLSSEDLIERVVASGNRPDRAGTIVGMATDGETFGHHHHFSDRTIAYALSRVAPTRGVRLASANEVVRTHTVSGEVRIRESSWSCAHGVGRWSSDCGCSTGGGPAWHQRWRTPLREALDELRDQASAIFVRRAEGVLRDPWQARDEYVNVVIGAQSHDEFFAAQAGPTADRSTATALLESQRLAMAMYTSCGWFFNDIAGIEARIVLRFAAGVLHHLRGIGETVDLAAFETILVKAEGNVGLNGDAVWAEVLAEATPLRPNAKLRDWAPIISAFDRAQEVAFRAQRTGAPIAGHDLDVVARALGLAPVPSDHQSGSVQTT